MERNKIVVEIPEGVTLRDEEFREGFFRWQRSIEEKIKTINERTKDHTVQIRELRKKLKEVKNG